MHSSRESLTSNKSYKIKSETTHEAPTSDISKSSSITFEYPTKQPSEKKYISHNRNNNRMAVIDEMKVSQATSLNDLPHDPGKV